MLLIERRPPDVGQVREAVAATFAARGTHPIPPTLAAPPLVWAEEFAVLAAEAGISTADYLVAFGLLDRFWSDNKLEVTPA